MKLYAAIRTIGTTLAMLACVSLAVAGSGLSREEAPRARAPGAAPRMQVRSQVPATTPAQIAPVAQRPAAPPAEKHRADRREHGRTAPGTSLNRHRPSSSRSRDALRNAHAAAGMGLLLHAGAGDERGLALLLDGVASAPSALGAGRAPPRASPHPTTARDPIACAAEPRSATVIPPCTPAGVTHPTYLTSRFRSAGRSPGRSCACPCRATTPRTAARLAISLERVPRSHAERFEGAPARIVPPLGGFTT